MSDQSNGSSGSGSPTRTIRTSSGSARLTASGSGNTAEKTKTSTGPVQREAKESPYSGSGPKAPRTSPAPPVGGTPSGNGDASVRASSSGVKMTGKSKRKGPRTVRLTVANVDPWSVMKLSFLMSVAIGIATVVAFFVLWLVLQLTGVFGSAEAALAELAGTEQAETVIGLFGLGRVLSVGLLLAVINIILITALSTLFAFLYNIGSSIVGGFHLTLTDD